MHRASGAGKIVLTFSFLFFSQEFPISLSHPPTHTLPFLSFIRNDEIKLKLQLLFNLKGGGS